MKVIIWISRIFVGLLFIFSGFIKANDALGFSYKLEEYFETFGKIFTENGLGLLAYPMEWMSHIALPMAMIIVVGEIVLGVLTLAGAFMEKVSKCLLVMIVFFTFLTFVSWYFGLVKTCGCFGEAIPLTPFESFIKDVILTILILMIFVFRKSFVSLFNEAGDKISLWSSFVLSALFTLYCYQHLPMLDFRAYAPGNSIKKGMSEEKGNPSGLLQFHNTKYDYNVSMKEFLAPMSDWKYLGPDASEGNLTIYQVKSKSTGKKNKVLSIPEEYKEDWEVLSETTANFYPDKDPKIQQLTAEYYKDRKNYLDVMLNHPSEYFWLIIRDFNEFGEFISTDNGLVFMPNKYGKSLFGKYAQLAKNAKRSKVKFHALCSDGSYEKIEAFRHSLELSFQFYICDDTELKTMIRSSPGLLLLKSDTIINKWHCNDFMNFEQINNQYINK